MSKSLYAHYYEERRGGQVLEAPCIGFVAYRIIPEQSEVFLDEVFVMPEHRKSGAGSALLNEVAERARAQGVKLMGCSISPAARGSSEAMAAAIAYGFRLLSTGPSEIFLVKEIN